MINFIEIFNCINTCIYMVHRCQTPGIFISCTKKTVFWEVAADESLHLKAVASQLNTGLGLEHPGSKKRGG